LAEEEEQRRQEHIPHPSSQSILSRVSQAVRQRSALAQEEEEQERQRQQERAQQQQNARVNAAGANSMRGQKAKPSRALVSGIPIDVTNTTTTNPPPLVQAPSLVNAVDRAPQEGQNDTTTRRNNVDRSSFSFVDFDSLFGNGNGNETTEETTEHQNPEHNGPLQNTEHRGTARKEQHANTNNAPVARQQTVSSFSI
jgi:hypothetical protein